MLLAKAPYRFVVADRTGQTVSALLATLPTSLYDDRLDPLAGSKGVAESGRRCWLLPFFGPNKKSTLARPLQESEVC